jgi:plastocyanin
VRRTTIAGSLVLLGAVRILVACTTDDSAASPTLPGPAQLVPGADGASPTADATAPNDAALDAPVEASGPVDAAGPDGAATSCDGGQLVAATWSFAVSANDGGPGPGQQLAIHRNDCVQWTNTDVGTLHSVVSVGDAGFSFHTAAATGKAAYAPVQFPVTGTFPYECGIHGPMMQGAVTVSP